MKFKFEKLTIWQKAMDFGEVLFHETKNFPKDELFNLVSQLRRASDSIALNIAEGATGQSNPEFHRFMGYAMRSLAEVVTCLYKAQRRGYITYEEFESNYNEAYNMMNMMASFRSKLKIKNTL
ncbi:four helix bundle protein [Pararhodonellum marinum]|uniref:four helix bundle protein n=1 Tax=Pararhodonellum marinum TaxID=2755358 RepID=UPI00188EA53E|nr:four helix bundle protein [Pararhodonellum marinum]